MTQNVLISVCISMITLQLVLQFSRKTKMDIIQGLKNFLKLMVSAFMLKKYGCRDLSVRTMVWGQNLVLFPMEADVFTLGHPCATIKDVPNG